MTFFLQVHSRYEYVYLIAVVAMIGTRAARYLQLSSTGVSFWVVCVLFVFCAFIWTVFFSPSTSSTTSVRADSSILAYVATKLRSREASVK